MEGAVGEDGQESAGELLAAEADFGHAALDVVGVAHVDLVGRAAEWADDAAAVPGGRIRRPSYQGITPSMRSKISWSVHAGHAVKWLYGLAPKRGGHGVSGKRSETA